MSLFERDENGVLHVVALSGGHDSSIMSFMLKEREPKPYVYICTPTGNELPEMWMFWRWLGSEQGLGRPPVPIMEHSLKSLIDGYNALPNFRDRWCTRKIKIEPYRKFLIEQAAVGPVVSYVGLRADEEGRAGGAYADIDGVTMRFPLREWGMGEDEVQAGLAERGIKCPNRTDCAVCYHQRLGEWYELWLNHPDLYAEGEAWEDRSGHTFRTPGPRHMAVQSAGDAREVRGGRCSDAKPQPHGARANGRWRLSRVLDVSEELWETIL